jgi:hypothetical protein
MRCKKTRTSRYANADILSIDLWKSVPGVRRSRLLKVRPCNFLIECAKTLNAKGLPPWRGGSRTGRGSPLRRCFQAVASAAKQFAENSVIPGAEVLTEIRRAFIAARKALRHLKTLLLAPATTALRFVCRSPLAAKDAARMGHPKIYCSFCWAAGPRDMGGTCGTLHLREDHTRR